MTEKPKGQKVAVTFMRADGLKLSYADLMATEPLIGYIRREDGFQAGSGMAYRTHSQLVILSDNVTSVPVAHLNNPALFDWNADGVIYEGWILVRDPETEKMRQVVQMWWIRNLEVLSVRPEIAPFKLKSGARKT
ncbi:hypothetical protein HH213_18050 [Duganella dendranthematis]|uniref:Uncharacterized protein n=1 Tax=Duganella dendranthematis TaxID=2728021 RepID=A0ABX6MBX6_9BURK|nr:hypothetical protein [Duganella dendranthematis]QJD91826.1 hypothetical protein HH213_18050 [Duganella dendranthematis]